MVPETTRIILPNSPPDGWYHTHGESVNTSSGDIQDAIYDFID